MTCPQCGHEPPAGSTFCNGCDAKLVMIRASCGATPPPDSRFCNGCGATLGAAPPSASASAGAASKISPPARDPRAYTPKHLADKILQSKSALEACIEPSRRGERKQVTVLFADVKGSMELAEQLDPHDLRRLRGDRMLVASRGRTKRRYFRGQKQGDMIINVITLEETYI